MKKLALIAAIGAGFALSACDTTRDGDYTYETTAPYGENRTARSGEVYEYEPVVDVDVEQRREVVRRDRRADRVFVDAQRK